jgi:predicted transcriptional regulator
LCCVFFSSYKGESSPFTKAKTISQVVSSQTRLAARRSAFEVMMDILKVAAERATKPTHLMYRSNTSWTVLNKHLGSLSASGLIMKDGQGSRAEFTITEKGKAVLHDYMNLVIRADPNWTEVRL